jgi:hypothetical protein
MRKYLIILKKIVFWMFFVSLFIVTLSTILVKIYEDEIEQYAINEINKYLNTKVDVQDIELSVFKNFPYASLDFNNVLIHDAYENIESDDTLLYAKNLYLNFNLIDIWNENYTVKNIQLKEGTLKIKTSKKGDVNYLITKPITDTTESNFNFQLEWLKVSDLKFEYSNIATKQFYLLELSTADFEGDFSEKAYNLKARSDLYIKKLKSNSFSLIKDKNAHLDLNLHIDTQKKHYTFRQGDLKIEKMPFQITGSISSESIQLNLKGKNIELDELSKTILNNSLEQSNNYEGKGKVNFNASIAGKLSKISMPSVEANFSIKNGTIKELKKNISLTHINLTGHYQNKQNNRSESLEFSNLSLQLLQSKFSGSTKISNFDIPTFKGKAIGNIDLASFHKFFKFKGVETINGTIEFNSSYSIKFPDIEYNPSLFDLENTNGTLTIKDVNYKGKNDSITYKNISGDILIIGNDAATKNLNIQTENSDFILNGAIKNLIPFIEGNGNLDVIASIESNKFDINEFITESSEYSEENRSPQVFEIPNNINLNIELDVKQLLWQSHKFEEITGNFILEDHKANINHFSLQTSGGSISGNILLNNLLEKGNVLEGKLHLEKLNIKNLFSDWNNFDQTTITAQNLIGTLSSDIELLLFFDQYFEIIEDKMFITTNMSILNGELNDMETMRNITEYMRSNKALKIALNKNIDQFEDKLIHLKFEELTNTIEIKNRKLTIPKMLIQTNALDVEFSGWHDFDNNIEYHFSFRFRELKSNSEYSEFGKIEDDGLGWRIYLTMTGNIDNPTYRIDKGEMRASFKENIIEEKATMKSVLKTEFGMFKKDTTINNIEEENKSDSFEFIIYEEDQDTTNDTIPNKSRNKKRSNKFFDKLKEKSELDKEVINQNEFE